MPYLRSQNSSQSHNLNTDLLIPNPGLFPLHDALLSSHTVLNHRLSCLEGSSRSKLVGLGRKGGKAECRERSKKAHDCLSQPFLSSCVGDEEPVTPEAVEEVKSPCNRPPQPGKVLLEAAISSAPDTSCFL